MGIVSRILLAGTAFAALGGEAQALTTYSDVTIPSSQTEFDTDNPASGAYGTYTLQGFNSSLGTLTGVTLTYSIFSNVDGTVTAQQAGVNNYTVTETVKGYFIFDQPLTTSGIPAGQANGTPGDPAYVSNQPYYNTSWDAYQVNSTSSQSYRNLAQGTTKNFGPFVNSTGSASFNATNLNDFIDHSFNVSAFTQTGQLIEGGGGNMAATLHTTAGGYAKVTYTYDPTTNISAVPETASWAMMLIGFGVVGGALRRRRPELSNNIG